MKTAKEILADSEEVMPAEQDPDLITIKLEIGDDGSILSLLWERNIMNIDLDHNSNELLFLTSDANDAPCVKLSALKEILKTHPESLEYSAVVSSKDEVSIYSVRIDRPIIGMGRSEDGMQYVIVANNE